MTAAWVVEGKGVSLPVMQLASSPQSPVQSPKLGSLGSFLLMFPSLSLCPALSLIYTAGPGAAEERGEEELALPPPPPYNPIHILTFPQLKMEVQTLCSKDSRLSHW